MKKLSLKPIALTLLTAAAALSLAACSNSRNTSTGSSEASSTQANSSAKKSTETSYFQTIDNTAKRDGQITLEHNGDELLRSHAVNTVYYQDSGMSEESIKQQNEQFDKNFADIKGFKHTVDYRGDHLVETTDMDFSQISAEDLKDKLKVELNSDQKPSYEKFVAALKNSSYKEVENGQFESLN